MKIKILEESQVVMSNYGSIHDYFAWPTLKRLKNGRLALGASGYRMEHICPFGTVLAARSEDGGYTWGEPYVIQKTPLDDRDAGLCAFGESGLIVASFNNTREMQRGWRESWCTEEEIAFNRAYVNSVTDEEESKYLGSTFKVNL